MHFLQIRLLAQASAIRAEEREAIRLAPVSSSKPDHCAAHGLPSPGGLSLILFAWLLTLHPAAAGRTCAAYGGMHIAVALMWLRFVEGIQLARWDMAGAFIALIGMPVIAFQLRL